jgi:protein DGCR14
VEKIIQRDFFPDLEKLKAQNAYLSAMQNNDIHMLRELYSKYNLGKRTPRPGTSTLLTLSLYIPGQILPGSGLDVLKPYVTLHFSGTLNTPTPSFFETPLGATEKATPVPSEPGTPTHLPMEEPKPDNDDAASVSSSKKSKSDRSDKSLNEYLDSYTSEDNKSFQDFMDEAHRKHKIKV